MATLLVLTNRKRKHSNFKTVLQDICVIQARWYMPVMLALKKLRQKDQSQVSLGYIVLCF
jgi:hypothetical protein